MNGRARFRVAKGREESEVDEGRARHEPNRGHGTAASRTRKGTEGTARCLSVYAPQGAPTRSGRRDERSENRRSVVRRHRAGSASGRRPGVRGSRRRGVGHDVSGEGRVGRGK